MNEANTRSHVGYASVKVNKGASLKMELGIMKGELSHTTAHGTLQTPTEKSLLHYSQEKGWFSTCLATDPAKEKLP